MLETALDPHALLAALKALEDDLGRTAPFRWGPRAIDLDILAYGDLRLDDPGLTIPHARLFERAFVLGPLAEIDPGFEAAFAALPEAERATLERVPASQTRSGASVHWDETLERVRSAAEFCASAGLARFRIQEADLEIEIRRSGRRPRSGFLAAVESPSAGESPEAGHSGNGSVPHDERPKTVLKAEFVGIVRLSRPSVPKGPSSTEDRELAYVESLGIRNPDPLGRRPHRRHIRARRQAVEYGQPLFDRSRRRCSRKF